jgi:hypothetical protein
LNNDEGKNKMKQFLILSHSYTSTQQFAKEVIQIIDRRINKVAHFENRYKRTSERHPDLKNKFKSEWFVIHSYENLKELLVFTLIFVVVARKKYKGFRVVDKDM